MKLFETPRNWDQSGRELALGHLVYQANSVNNHLDWLILATFNPDHGFNFGIFFWRVVARLASVGGTERA